MKAKIFLAISLIISVLVNAQERTITGKVTDETGSALPGAMIRIKERNVGVTADSLGKFSINVKSSDKTLVFSFVGYAQSEVTIGNKTIVLDLFLNKHIIIHRFKFTRPHMINQMFVI